jgi:hypothetical protein
LRVLLFRAPCIFSRTPWYERLTEFLINNGYNRGGIDKALFVKKNEEKIMIAQIYVDHIVFGGMSDMMVEHLFNK